MSTVYQRWTSIRTRKFVLALGAAAAFAAISASSALATPKGAYAVFAQCPTSTPGVFLCQYAQTTGGEVDIGNTKVPINKTITLQGGGIAIAENVYALVPAKNGESLSKTELNVPGGLLDFVNCEEIKGEGFLEKGERGACKAVFENGTTGVTATTELVATASNPAILDLGALFSGTTPSLTLPVRVHLKNPFLGNSCYIGSTSSPIQLHLTTGTTAPPLPNKPIKGNPGVPSEEEEVVVLTGNSLVDNAFSAPGASGCGEFLFVTGFLNGIVNSKIGLPAAAGHNTAILNGTLKAATAENVIKSE